MIFCSLYSGSSGNSMFIASNKAKILIDAGLPGKKIDLALQEINENPKDLNGIFITHEHSDHIKGLEYCLESMTFLYMQMLILGLLWKA